MSGPYFQSFLLFGMIAAVAFFIYDVTKWTSLGSLISNKTRILRICLLVLVEVMLITLFYGPQYLQNRTPIIVLSYWCIIVALILGILVVSLLDVREVIHGLRRVNREIYNSIKKDQTNK